MASVATDDEAVAAYVPYQRPARPLIDRYAPGATDASFGLTYTGCESVSGSVTSRPWPLLMLPLRWGRAISGGSRSAVSESRSWWRWPWSESC